jgi:hypothetical protein
MKAITIVYNKVQDSVLSAEASTVADGIGEYMFATAAVNAEITLYHWYLTTDNREVWLIWRVQIKEWLATNRVPEIVKLTRMMLE